MVRFHRLDQNFAVEILSVDPRSPAGLAGLQRNDLLVAIRGTQVQSVDDLHRFLSDWPIGRSVEIDIIRGQNRRTLSIIPREAVH